MLTKNKIQIVLLLAFGILVLLNIVSNNFFFRLDFTADQRYTLSDATVDILEDLDDVVTVKAYFTEDVPPVIQKAKKDFKDLLIEYGQVSDGNVVFEFINPNEDKQLEMEAQQNGIRPLSLNTRESDQIKQQRAYLGALIEYGETKEIIPVIQPGAAMEFALSSGIKKLTTADKPKVGFLTSFGAQGTASMMQLMQQLSVLYTPVDVTIDDTTDIPQDVNTLVVVAPADTVEEKYFTNLDNFLARGGKMVLALNAVKAELQQQKGDVLETGFGNWLRKKGIDVENKFVVDANCQSINVQEKQGMFVMNTPVQFPFIPNVSNFEEHPITAGLEEATFIFASPVTVTADSSLKYYPLAKSSNLSGVQNAPTFFNVRKQWARTDFTAPDQVLAAAFEGKLNGVNSKMVVFGDGDFVVNGQGQQMQQLSPDNISLMANSIDWLSDETGLVTLRTKTVTSRPIDPSIEDGTKMFIKIVNFVLPLLLVIGYGIYRAQINRTIKKKLEQTDYV